MTVPPILEVSSVQGRCNASCVMCPVHDMPERVIMSNPRFEQLMARLAPYAAQMRMASFVGMGEPLLDPGLEAKIRMAKRAGFAATRVVTNGAALTARRSRSLLEAGLDVAIISVDSIDRAVYESIRVDLKLDRVIANIKQFLAARDQLRSSAAVHIRMVVLDVNADHLDGFHAFWSPLLDPARGDLVLAFPEHNWPRSDPHGRLGQVEYPKTSTCAYVWDRLTIQATGKIQLCCVDNTADFFDLGNAFDVDPIEVYNGAVFSRVRELMSAGRINEIQPCRNCNVPLKREARSILGGAG